MLSISQHISRKSFFILFTFTLSNLTFAQHAKPSLQYIISFPNPATHTYTVQLHCSNWKQDSILLKMPKWMPGYYQLMDYANSVENLQAYDSRRKKIPVEKTNGNSWRISGIKNRPFTVSYTISTKKQFVANSYSDSAHAYIVPGNTFLYINGLLNIPVSVRLSLPGDWKNIATGLDPVPGKMNEFTAPDFDILYDCPILTGTLRQLPSFKVKGIEHRFIAYDPGNFNENEFMGKLKKIVEAAAAIIGDIPYKQYSFIGIGPGRGGIEHLNNTTISFDGAGLSKPAAMKRMLNFIAHEYFHHYNVKRIRPFELGPFDYETENRTNLLWVSEGLSVYYEYLIVKRAGLADAATLLENFEANLNKVQNNPGRYYQSLQQASYSTWSEGPFGTQGTEPGKTISYYDKGPLVGLILDLEIRHATENKRSLDDAMRYLYWKYYKEKQRGFTEAEFQQTCEETAGISLNNIFEYVYTTREPDYEKYLSYAGLKIEKQEVEVTGKTPTQKFRISRIEYPSLLQSAILKSWMGE